MTIRRYQPGALRSIDRLTSVAPVAQVYSTTAKTNPDTGALSLTYSNVQQNDLILVFIKGTHNTTKSFTLSSAGLTFTSLIEGGPSANTYRVAYAFSPDVTGRTISIGVTPGGTYWIHGGVIVLRGVNQTNPIQNIPSVQSVSSATTLLVDTYLATSSVYRILWVMGGPNSITCATPGWQSDGVDNTTYLGTSLAHGYQSGPGKWIGDYVNFSQSAASGASAIEIAVNPS